MLLTNVSFSIVDQSMLEFGFFFSLLNMKRTFSKPIDKKLNFPIVKNRKLLPMGRKRYCSVLELERDGAGGRLYLLAVKSATFLSFLFSLLKPQKKTHTHRNIKAGLFLTSLLTFHIRSHSTFLYLPSFISQLPFFFLPTSPDFSTA